MFSARKDVRVACIIPARLASTRFPRKVLANILDKPLLQWVWYAAVKTSCFEKVLFAVDACETADLIERFGGEYVMTSPDCPTGTDRLIEVVNSGKIDADIWVNWQADEPFVSQNLISTLLSSLDNSDIWTLKKRIKNKGDVSCPNIVKVVCDFNDHALYFSRSVIPFYREGFDGKTVFYKHIGIYAYTTQALQKIANLRRDGIEVAEKIEQLRFLQGGLKIKVHEVNEEVVGIDTPQDLLRAEKFARSICNS